MENVLAIMKYIVSVTEPRLNRTFKNAKLENMKRKPTISEAFQRVVISQFTFDDVFSSLLKFRFKRQQQLKWVVNNLQTCFYCREFRAKRAVRVEATNSHMCGHASRSCLEFATRSLPTCIGSTDTVGALPVSSCFLVFVRPQRSIVTQKLQSNQIPGVYTEMPEWWPFLSDLACNVAYLFYSIKIIE